MSTLQSKYDANADGYSQFLTTPLGQLEAQLFTLALPPNSCTDFKVLDLGGGTGLRALDALTAGASHADVVDISPQMLQTGQNLHPSSKITWLEGDCSKSLSNLPLDPGSYDLVIANGIFDHAHNASELEMMWQNCSTYLKPSGRLLANRNNPFSKAATAGTFGVHFSAFTPLPSGEGLSFKYRMLTDPPLEFESMALDVYYSGSKKVPDRYFCNLENVPWEETPIVKADPGFWKEYLEDPILFIFTATKKPEESSI